MLIVFPLRHINPRLYYGLNKSIICFGRCTPSCFRTYLLWYLLFLCHSMKTVCVSKVVWVGFFGKVRLLMSPSNIVQDKKLFNTSKVCHIVLSCACCSVLCAVMLSIYLLPYQTHLVIFDESSVTLWMIHLCCLLYLKFWSPCMIIRHLIGFNLSMTMFAEKLFN